MPFWLLLIDNDKHQLMAFSFNSWWPMKNALLFRSLASNVASIGALVCASTSSQTLDPNTASPSSETPYQIIGRGQDFAVYGRIISFTAAAG